jgi:formate dehydrogenase major subunit
MEEPNIESILKEISGYTVADNKPVPGFAALKDDGSTACGGWIYSGVYADGVNQARRRKPWTEQPLAAREWGWAWPADRRVLYNRASADPSGKPWSERKKYVWWDEEQGKWTGLDVPDFNATKRPDYKPDPDAKGDAAIPGDGPFHRQRRRAGWLFAPIGLKDGPMPIHYEPGRVAGTEPALRQGPVHPDGEALRQAGQPLQQADGPEVPARGDDLQAHRAPHQRGDEPLDPVALRASA